MNKFVPIKTIGMPYHGLAEALNYPSEWLTLTTSDGDKLVKGNGGAVVVRHPSAPGASRTPAQQVNDTANGYEWRDYALLCGGTRAVNGGPELGRQRWLYCSADGRTWVMSVEKSVAGNVFTLEIWRRALFGYFGPNPPSITDEKVGEVAIPFVLPSDYTGVLTAADVAASAWIDRAACTVPSPDGSSVFVHVMADEDVYWATEVVMEDKVGGTYAIVPVTISGTGDVANGGVGITASFGTVDQYDDLVIEAFRGGSGLADRAPNDWYGWECVGGRITEDHPNPPLSAGLTYTDTYWTEWANPNAVYGGDTGVKDHRRAVVYRTHQGDVEHAKILDWSGWIYTTVNAGRREIVSTFLSVFDYYNPGTGVTHYKWQAQGSVYTDTMWWDEESRFEPQEEVSIKVGGVEVAGRWQVKVDHRKKYYWGFVQSSSCTLWTGNNVVGTLPSDIYLPDEYESTIGTIAPGFPMYNVDMEGDFTIYPGMIIMQFHYTKPDYSNLKRFQQVGVGIGENSVAKFMDEYIEFSAGVWPPPINLVQNRWAFQPVTLEGVHDTETGIFQYV